jgi:hypothetical protein
MAAVLVLLAIAVAVIFYVLPAWLGLNNVQVIIRQ